uniref:Reverse transcriptase domain-containing protein n=1 Tax=Kalanchoe fedtschenkoi TaxID=63787 RepID=A0A7N0ZWN0_KALFE
MKDKIKNLNLDEELKDSLKKLLINSESETESSSDTETETDSSGSTNLGNLNETIDSEDNACYSSCEKPCLKQDSEDEIYKLISQFKDNDSLNVLKGNDLIEFLQSIKDKELRSKLIDSMDIPSSSETRQSEETYKIDSNPYMMSEVFKTLRQKQKTISETPTSVLDLKIEIDNLKDEIKMLKQINNNLNQRVSKLEDKTPSDLINPNEPLEEGFLSVINMITAFKFHIKIKLLINKSFMIELIALIDSGADVSVIQEGLIPTKYFEKTTHSLRHVGGEKLQINFKIPKAYICNNKVCIPESFLLVTNITNQVILGTPFLKQIFPITHIDDKYFEGTFQNQKVHFQFITEPQTKVLNEIKDIILQKYSQINFLKSEVTIYNIEIDLKNPKLIDKIKRLKLSLEICNDHPNAFWNRKKYIVSLPYEESFKEQDIPTKSRPCQMNSEYMELCKTEVNNLLGEGLIIKSNSPCSCIGFYVNKHSEIERGVPRLVINYKPLNKVLKWIRHPIPNKKDLLDKLHDAIIFSKFDLKSRYWQIQIAENDQYKTAFNVPIGHYEWRIMPFGLKNPPSEFQKIMNDIFIPYSQFIIVYIDDILVFSKNIQEHFNHLDLFKKLIIQNGLVVSKPKMLLFQTKIRFLGHNIEKGKILPINRSIEFASKFPDEILEKQQL